MQIIDLIREEIEKKSIPVLKLSKETGIPSYRIYKWLDGKGSPKHEDSTLLQEWLSESSKVQIKATPIHTKTIVTGTISGKKDYQGLYEELLRNYNEMIKEYNECLKANSTALAPQIKLIQGQISRLFVHLGLPISDEGIVPDGDSNSIPKKDMKNLS